uniref:H15 domain-containing protein n=1 Tax=Angiostrongylus cantonensis TaxID=6313 RepID=A0A0K0DHD1_ANGCA
MTADVAGSRHASAKASKQNTAKKAWPHPGHPTVIRNSVGEPKERAGSSKIAIRKFVLSHYNPGDNVAMADSLLRKTPEKAVMEGELMLVKGNEASGSFGFGEKKTALASKKHVGRKLAMRKNKFSEAATRMPKAGKKASVPKANIAKKFIGKATTKPKASSSKMRKVGQ